MNKNLIKELKDIIWKEGIVEPTEIIVRFYEKKGMKFSPDDKLLFSYYKPETLLRECRNLSKPTSPKKQTSFDDYIN